MKLVKIIPYSQRAKNRVKGHGETMEILLDKGDSFIVRSLQQTFKYKEDLFGKWVGTFTKEEASYEEVNDDSNIIES